MRRSTSHRWGIAAVCLCRIGEDADQDKITQAIRADPLFLGEDTQVFPVESLAELEQEGREWSLIDEALRDDLDTIICC